MEDELLSQASKNPKTEDLRWAPNNLFVFVDPSRISVRSEWSHPSEFLPGLSLPPLATENKLVARVCNKLIPTDLR